MTVEQPPVHEHYKPTAESEVALTQLKEITGVNDEALLGNALALSITERGGYDMDKAFSLVVDENPSQKEMDAQPLEQAHTSLPGGESRALEDNLGTCDPNERDDLQKAIVLSLQEQTNTDMISKEDRDISRALEQSILENKAGAKRKRGEWEWFVDSLNPYERMRSALWPVGLKNIGNTCWFSAVIQSLYHLPVFRSLVLNYRFPQDSSEQENQNVLNKKSLKFMRELRLLFAMLWASNRKYVDPTQAIDVFRESLQGGSGDSQQDVSEFTHKLLEWLEEAFDFEDRSDACSTLTSKWNGCDNSCTPMRKNNAVVELFSGQYRVEGRHDGNPFSNYETFGQYPLQVKGYNDLYQCLEMATAPEEIEAENGGEKSGFERWFTRLPPVLIFELSRFQFNHQLGTAEKIHNQLDFPEILFIDRFMECNKHITRKHREELKRLKEQLAVYQSKLEKYLHYGNGSKRVPLSDVLQYTLDFASSRREEPNNSAISDIEMSSPSRRSDSEDDMGAVPKPSHTVLVPPSPELQNGQPSPKYISSDERWILESCLKRWRVEVETDVKGLQDHVNFLSGKISEAYNNENLRKVPYRLHAVLVHEGQCSTGHYWAYVYDLAARKWLKFNDNTVTEAKWEELVKESVGGYRSTTAYCLIYVDAQDQSLFESDFGEENVENVAGHVKSLTSDLKSYVDADNIKFCDELKTWNVQQKAVQSDPECSIIAEEPVINKSTPSHGPMHTYISYQDTRLIINKVSHLTSHGIETALQEAIHIEMSRLQELGKNIHDDHRLKHVLVYLCQNGVSSKAILHRTMMEQFTCPLLDNDSLSKEFRKVAVKELEMMLQGEEQHEYKRLHCDYENFVLAVCYFIEGVSLFVKETYQESVVHFQASYDLNHDLVQRGTRRGMSQKLIAYLRRQALLHLNEQACAQFESSRDKSETVDMLTVVTSTVLPMMVKLCDSNALEDDRSAVEEIRSKWFNFLGHSLDWDKQERLQDLLGKLTDVGTETKEKQYFMSKNKPGRRMLNVYTPNTVVADEFNLCMENLRQLGYVEKATASR